MGRCVLWRIALSFFCIVSMANAAPADIPFAQDLRKEAASAHKLGRPLILVFSRADCKFCRAVKRDFLRPLLNEARLEKRQIIRQIAQDSEQMLLDFDGRPTSHAQFAAQNKIRLVPVVGFYGPHGEALASPIVGASLPDFYGQYLDQNIEQATQTLRRQSP